MKSQAQVWFVLLAAATLLSALVARELFPKISEATPSEVLNFTGLAIGALSLVLSLLLAALAVSAYANVREIESLSQSMSARKGEIDAQLSQSETRIHVINGRFAEVDHSFTKVDSTVGELARFVEDTMRMSVEMFSPAASGSQEFRLEKLSTAIMLSRARYRFSRSQTDKERIDSARDLINLGDPADKSMVLSGLKPMNHPDAKELVKHLESMQNGDIA